jgi:TPR repeat protein
MSNAYDMGKGVIRDDVVATTYLTRACTLANGFACLRLASKSREANDPVASATFVALACEHSCGVFCPPDEAAAENDFGLAAAREYRTWRERCDRGNATICEPR